MTRLPQSAGRARRAKVAVRRATVAARRATVVALTVALSTLGLGLPQLAKADTSPPQGLPATVSADALPTWQVNGVVWSQAVVGNTVYATGSFSKARPPGVAAGGAGEISVGNLLAYDITTGNRISVFNHTLNAQGMAVTASPDGQRLFVGGDFTAVDGSPRQHVAMFNISTAAGVLAGFAPYVGGQVRALDATDSQVYVGGAYTAAGGATRKRLSAFTNAGALLPWAPSADDENVWSLVIAPDGSRVIVGGAFTTLSGQPNYGMGSTDATTGALLPWAINQTVRDAGSYGAITSLTTDGTKIYGSGYSYGSGTNFEGTFGADPTTGALIFVNDCHGDTYDTFSTGQVIYSVSHAHDCTWVGDYPDTEPRVRWEHVLAQTNYPTGTNTGPDNYGWNYNGKPDSTLLHFFPQLSSGSFTGQYQAAWTVEGNSSYVVLGGEFPTVNGTGQQGLVRMALKSIAPNKQGPSYTTNPPVTTPPTTATSLAAGTARVTFGTAWDYDNESLTYDLRRDGVTWVNSAQIRSSFWLLPSSGLVDTGLVPGSQHSYQVRITDPYGNTQWSTISNTVTISSTPASTYAQDIFAAHASSYWRLDEPSGAAVVDWAGGAVGTAGSGVSRGAAGAIIGDSDPASTFNGSSTSSVATNQAVRAPAAFSLEAWVKTTSTAGGQVIGFGSSKTGNSASHDRQLYLDNAGHVWFAVNPNGTVKAVSSADTYRDGAWHQLVGSLNASGMTLYVDGKKLATDAATTSAKAQVGFWRIGGDNLTGLPNKPTSNNLKGTIDEVAFYTGTLALSQVQQHYIDSGRSLVIGPNQNPTASFTSSAVNLAASFNGSGSSDPDGTIASYSWNFGDGTAAGTGVTPSHTYAVAGTYQVTLTVTDNQGATGSVTNPITVTAAANQSPTASFTSSAANLVASFDGSGSSDPDGTIASYSWNFGDGTPAGSGVTPSHTYAAAGTYQVALTVTDNQSATGSVTHPVTVTSGGAVVTLASDDFGRTLSSSWGAADLGGSWSVTSPANSSVGGGVGNLAMAAAGSGPAAYLSGMSSTDTDAQVQLSLDRLPLGGTSGADLSLIARRVGTEDYRGKARILSTGAVRVSIARTASNGAQTSLTGEATVAGLTYAVGDSLLVRVQATGTGTTQLKVKLWKFGASEPTAWALTSSDTTATLQAAGGAGIHAYLSAAVTNPPVTASYDSFRVYAASTLP